MLKQFSWWSARFRPHLKTKRYSPGRVQVPLPAPALYHKRMNSIWPCNVSMRHLLGESRKGKGIQSDVKRASQTHHGKTRTEDLQKGGMSAGSQQRLWCWTRLASQDHSACGALEGMGVGEIYSEFSRTKSHVLYRVTPTAQRARAFTLSIFTVHYGLLLNW